MPSKSGGRSSSQTMCCTYRLYDRAHRLLYVGVADDFDKRWKGHERTAWWSQVAYRDVIWFDNRLDALYEESRAIAYEWPMHNRREGISPLGLRVIRTRDWRGTPHWVDTQIAATRPEKAAVLRGVAAGRDHAWVAYDGEPRALVVPVDWYLAACKVTGQPTDLTSAQRIDWADL